MREISRRSSRITLRDDRTFRLRDSNDVNDENKGIIVYPDENDEDHVVYLDWEDFDRVEFEK